MSKLHKQAAEILRQPGAVVLLPTETVYGLVCRAADAAACQRIFELKRRPGNKLLGWFVSGTEMLEKHGILVNETASKLIDRYAPGALTIISKTASGATQGYRIPDHPLIAGILEELDEPLAQTSANSSGEPDAKSCAEALSQLNGQVDFYVDGGALQDDAAASTVVDTTTNEVKILRRGAIDVEGFLNQQL